MNLICQAEGSCSFIFPSHSSSNKRWQRSGNGVNSWADDIKHRLNERYMKRNNTHNDRKSTGFIRMRVYHSPNKWFNWAKTKIMVVTKLIVAFKMWAVLAITLVKPLKTQISCQKSCLRRCDIKYKCRQIITLCHPFVAIVTHTKTNNNFTVIFRKESMFLDNMIMCESFDLKSFEKMNDV